MNSSACAARAAAARIVRVGRVGARVGDVLAHRAAEQRRLLRHDADRAAQVAERELAHVDAVERDACPAVTSQKRGSSDAMVVLPAPEGPTSATTSPGAMRERHVVQHVGQVGAVAEGHVLERTSPRTGMRQRRDDAGSATVGFVSSSSNTRCAAPIASWYAAEERRQRADGGRNEDRVEQELDERAGRERTGEHEASALPEHRRQRRRTRRR